MPLFLQRPKGPVAPNGVFLSWLKCLYTLKLEAWLSGLRHRFAKSAYIVYVPWVQIPLLPRITLYTEDLIPPKIYPSRIASVFTPTGAYAPLGALQCANKHGDITQLVECLPCTQEVIGSSPFISRLSSPNEPYR